MGERPTVREVNPLTASRCRTFKLVREDDETGISGTGVVAEGIELGRVVGAAGVLRRSI